jgi:hypothetical protein
MAVVTPKLLTVLDPRTAPAAPRAVRAPRPASLRGQRIGLLANGKPNSEEFLVALGALLRERHGVERLAVVGKPSANRVAPADLLDRLAAHSDLVITAVGD